MKRRKMPAASDSKLIEFDVALQDTRLRCGIDQLDFGTTKQIVLDQVILTLANNTYGLQHRRFLAAIDDAVA